MLLRTTADAETRSGVPIFFEFLLSYSYTLYDALQQQAPSREMFVGYPSPSK